MGEQAGDQQRVVIVDGSNVAYSTEGDGPKLENILLVSRKLQDEGYRPVVVVDAALRHNIDRRSEFEALVDAGSIKQAPPRTDADYFILSFARDLDASVVSNDRFHDRRAAFPEASERVIRYMIVDRNVVLERRSPRRPSARGARAEQGDHGPASHRARQGKARGGGGGRKSQEGGRGARGDEADAGPRQGAAHGG